MTAYVAVINSKKVINNGLVESCYNPKVVFFNNSLIQSVLSLLYHSNSIFFVYIHFSCHESLLPVVSYIITAIDNRFLTSLSLFLD